MTETQAARRECAEKRTDYLHARDVYGEATRLVGVRDLSALEGELHDALLAYYAAHGALHGAMRRASLH